MFLPSHLLPHLIPLGCYRALALSSLCHTANSHWLSTLHMVMYMFQCYSLKSCHLLSPQLWPKISSLCLHLHCWSWLILNLCHVILTFLFSWWWQLLIVFAHLVWGCHGSLYDEWFLTEAQAFFGEGNSNPLQYSCLENPMDEGAWWAAVHGVTKSLTRLSDYTFTFHFHALEREMATHSSVLAWRIPGTGEPGGLSMGSHRVGHQLDWCDLAAAGIFVLCYETTSYLILLFTGFLWHLFSRGHCSAALLLPGGDRSPGFLQGICWHLRQWGLLVSPG